MKNQALFITKISALILALIIAAIVVSPIPAFSEMDPDTGLGPDLDLVEEVPEAYWTVLIYINGNSETILQEYNEASLEAIEAVGSDRSVNFVVQISRGDRNSEAERILCLSDKRNVLENLGPTKMGDKAVLEDFLDWGMERFPAENYMIVLKGHGVGHRGLMKDINTEERIYLTDLEEMMNRLSEKHWGNIGVFGLDSCHMANAETAWALRDSVDYLVGSEEISYAPNWEYGIIAKNMKTEVKKDGLTPKETAMIIAKSAENDWLTTISVIDCSMMDKFAEKLTAFSEAILNTETDDGIIRETLENSQHFSQRQFWPDEPNEDYYAMLSMRDLSAICSEFINNDKIKDEKIKAAAAELKEFVKENVVKYHSSKDVPELAGSTGLCIYAPVRDVEKYGNEYATQTTLGEKTGWARVVEKYGR